MVHNTIVDALARFLKDCGMDNVLSEVKYWDPARIGSDGSRRVPDVTCTSQCWWPVGAPKLAWRRPLPIGQSVSEICDMPIRMIVGRLTSSAAHNVF